VWRDNERRTTVKENDDSGWSSDGVVLWQGRRLNWDMVEWWGEWPRLRWPFYSSGWWKSCGPERVAGGGGADLILQFWLGRGGDGMKHCQKMKRRQRARLGSMGRRHDMTQRHGLCQPKERRHWGGEREETMPVELMQILLEQKMKKIHAVDSTAINGWWRFKTTMS
jgi:hypothetical protein